MTEIDQALEALRANPDDHKAQSGFYDLFLNMSFFVPTINETVEHIVCRCNQILCILCNRRFKYIACNKPRCNFIL